MSPGTGSDYATPATDFRLHLASFRAAQMRPSPRKPRRQEAENLCDKLNRRLGLPREDWTELAARSMRAETPEPSDPTEH